MTANITEWFPYIETDVPGCPAISLTRAIRDALIEFCRETKFWRKELDPISLTDTNHTYDLVSPAGALVVNINNVLIEDSPIDPTNEDWLKNNIPGWEVATGTSPTLYFRPEPQKIRVYPTLNQDITDGMVVGAVLKPSDDATTVEDFFFQDFREEIMHGAKSKLFEQGNTPWHNKNTAESERRLFQAAISTIRWRALKGDVSQIITAETTGMGW